MSRKCPGDICLISLMVGLAAHDLEGSVYLLKQHDACEIMRQCDLAKRERFVSALVDRFIHAIRATNAKRDIARPMRHQLIETLCDAFTRTLRALDRKQYEVRIACRPNDLVTLEINAPIGNLDDAQLGVAAEALRVFRNRILPEAFLELAYGYDGYSHACSYFHRGQYSIIVGCYTFRHHRGSIMANQRYTLTSYDPVYVVAEEVRIPEEAVRKTALRWLELNVCKEGETPKLNDQWIAKHVEDLNTVEELLIFIRYNMYKDNVEVQQLADQNVICRELATRLVEDPPQDLVEEALYASAYRLEEMLRMNGLQKKDYCEQRGISEEQLDAEVRENTIESLKEDSALAAWADHANYTLSAEDFYEIIPGDSVQDKAYKRRQIELEGRMPQMEEYALKAKALRDVMENAMIKRTPDDKEWMRYGDTSKDVLDANKQFPDSFISL